MRAKNFWKNTSEKSAKNFFLYSHEYRDQKMVGKKLAKQFFQKHTNSASKKCWGKNRRKKVRKTFLYIHTNIVAKKWGGKNARNNFSINTLIVKQKMLGRKSSEKSAKNVFLYSHEYHDQKMGGIKCAKQFFHKHTNSARKKCWGKKVGKKC